MPKGVGDPRTQFFFLFYYFREQFFHALFFVIVTLMIALLWAKKILTTPFSFLRALQTTHHPPSLCSIVAAPCINGQELNLILFAEGGHWELSFWAVKFTGRHRDINFEWFFSIVKLLYKKRGKCDVVKCIFSKWDAPFFNQGTHELLFICYFVL